jgi:two-component system response regulator YesN
VRVLIADDDRELASALASYVGHCNEEVVATVTSGGIDVVKNVDRFHPDIIIMDIMMPRLNGLTVCLHILSRFPQTKIILLSGKLSADHHLVKASGAAAFLAKPIRLSDLQEVMAKLVHPPLSVVRIEEETPDECADEDSPSSPVAV